MWIVLTIAAGACLLFYCRRKNAVWAGLTIGLLLGLIAAGCYYFAGDGFQWVTVQKWTVVSILVGTIVELSGRKSA